MGNLIKTISQVNSSINSLVWGIPMIVLILFTGIFYTVRTKAFQITHVKDIYNNTIRGLFKNKIKSDKKNAITSFQALSTALAATIGTGNIAGVSTAIVVGGPGSIFWMWICAIFGMITHFAEITLGIYYRKSDTNGYSGGPMYYLENGFKDIKLPYVGKVLAILFAFFTFITSFGTGNMTQINSISDALKSNFSVSPVFTGFVLAIFAGFVIIGGIKRIAQFTEKIVPLMSAFYILVGLIILFTNLNHIPFVFSSIFSSAFSTQAIAGGVLGYVLKRAMTYGFKRGAFSNEAGLGSSVIAHSAANCEEPIEQAMWGIFEVFFDTIIVCSITAFIVLSATFNAESFDNKLQNLTIEESIVKINNENDFNHLINDNYYRMPIKLDSNNNSKIYSEIPDASKEYIKVNIYDNEYYVETLEEKDCTENDYFWTNALYIKANPILHTDGTVVYNEKNNPVVDSIHIEKVNGVSLVSYAISTRLSHYAGKILAIAVVLFAFSTTLGWSYYGSKTVEYLFGEFATIIYKILFVVFIVIGATMKLDLAWDIADTMNGLMAIPNLIGVLILSPVVIKILKNYSDRKKNLTDKKLTNYQS